MSPDAPGALAAAERIVSVITALRIRNELWSEEGGDAQLPQCVLKNPDVAAYDRINDDIPFAPQRGSSLHRLVAGIIAEAVMADPIRLRAVIAWKGDGVIRRKTIRLFDVATGRELVGADASVEQSIMGDSPPLASLTVDLVDVEHGR